MGKLIEGEWHDVWYDTKHHGGKFIRSKTQFHHRISADGGSGFQAEPHRYHLYVSFACPWAHRTLLFRHLKKLEEIISISVVDPYMANNGWEFSENPGCIPDTINHCDYLYEVYLLADPKYTGRVTVPVLWDKKTKQIVNNESAEIIRMLNREFNALTGVKTDYCPDGLIEAIEVMNKKVYTNVNNGVYRCGFATAQDVYERAYDALFSELDELEKLLDQQRYLVGNCLTEADWRLFTTLLRFDAVYYSHFKCNRQRIIDFPNLYAYLCDLYQTPGVAETVHFDHIKQHYYRSHTKINPTQIVPKGPQLDFTAPHHRERFV